MEDLSNYPGLKRRNNTWYVRKRVPQDVSDMYNSETVSKSLGTETLEHAKKLYHKQMLIFENDFEQKRILKINQKEADQLSKFSDVALLGLALEWFQEKEGKWEKAKLKSLSTQHTDAEVEHLLNEARLEHQSYISALKCNNYEIVYPSAQRYLKKRNISYSVSSESYRKFCYYVAKALEFSLQNDIKEFQGKSIIATLPPIFGSLPDNYKFGINTKSETISLSDLLEKFLKQTERQNISEKNNKNYRLVVSRLNDYAGKELDLQQVNRNYLEEYRNTLLKYPNRLPAKHKNLSFSDALNAAEKHMLTTLSVKTVNTHMTCLHSLFEYAYLNDFITKNPVQKLTLLDPEQDSEKRYPWPVEKLNKIFRTPLFTPDNPKQFSSSKYDEALYWFCLISLWTGMSKKEISQFQISDLRSENHILFLDVVDRPELGANLKNQYRIRKIPVHKELIRLGLPEFFNKRKDRTWLFSELTGTSINGRSHYIGKRFADLIKKYDLDSPKCSFHSFRHNYRDALRDTEMNKNIQYALGGWSGGENKTVADNYGSGYSISKLNENLQKISYKGLDLKHLYV